MGPSSLFWRPRRANSSPPNSSLTFPRILRFTSPRQGFRLGVARSALCPRCPQNFQGGLHGLQRTALDA
eukprot:5277740-Pyramimonas_sp.AAC.1